MGVYGTTEAAETGRAFKQIVYVALRTVYCGEETTGGAHCAASACH